MRTELRGEVDRALEDQLELRGGGPQRRDRRRRAARATSRCRRARAGRRRTSRRSTPATASSAYGSELEPLPVSERAREVAAGVSPSYFADADVRGTDVRVLTVPVGRGVAVQLGRSLESADAVLARLRVILALVCLGGVALAVVLGRLASRNVVAPIAAVSEAARHIAATEDLGRRIEVATHDEVGELAAQFNAMLDTLEHSIAAQRQLVADASHELRTPITSLRTNIEVLAEAEALPADERARLLADVEEQTTELGMLVADLIELARGDVPLGESEDVRLDELVREAVVRARRHAPSVRFEVASQPAVVEGTRERLARAVNNLLDNAAKHSQRRRGRGGAEPIPVACACATSVPASIPPISRISSTASTAARRRAGGPARGSAWRSCARSPSSTAAACGRRTRRAAGPSSCSTCPPSARISKSPESSLCRV